jgi:NAD(P)-dependent dehydrogenase (short-subunit alcohol dehydrogenase family)
VRVGQRRELLKFSNRLKLRVLLESCVLRGWTKSKSRRGICMKNRVAIITGGNRGIGKAIAVAFGKAGVEVVLAARKLDLSESVLNEIMENGGGGLCVKCDLTRDEDIYDVIKKTMDRYGKIDILVNNSGISPFLKKSEEVTKEMWMDVIQVNLLAPFLLCREAGKIMIQQNWGRIINIASVGGLIALPRQIAYCATKGALIQMTKVLAVEWAGKYNITVNCIAPGYFATDLTEGMRSSEKIRTNLLQRNPSNRFGDPDEIANAALYLASEGASFTTGSVLVVDGGMMAA